jgi:hypothetical protein
MILLIRREVNLYKEGQRTHFGQELERWNVPRAVAQIKVRVLRSLAHALKNMDRFVFIPSRRSRSAYSDPLPIDRRI